MVSLADQLLVLVMLINFIMLGSSRMAFVIRAVAAQGVILGIIPGLLHPFSGHLLAITVSIILAKGVVIPYLLNDAVRKAQIRREVEPFIGYVPTLLLGAVFTALAFVFAQKLPLAPEHRDLLFVPASIATLMTGFLILTTRKKAISQVIGYLVLENGIFIFGLLLAEAMPFMVEAGALLDLLVGIFVMGIVINHISREFSSVDTSRLQTLREE
ncbi:hydrogenase [Trichlorobacter lovleyi]|uniref:NAD-dependent dehydrogenase subunit n=1 Tax=Trichlorobacter lovleyi (strain ATCC BAA-1151 / DSM 17278 / SZ) TaxID=398767 RepID=B3E6C3_TRIL1|nr:hydrogenase [Trichlorobacter lovleyi]ACD96270.1 NAD-dependent dehydrogenase subunit [Trichlorobacter lovleyi SZ]